MEKIFDLFMFEKKVICLYLSRRSKNYKSPDSIRNSIKTESYRTSTRVSSANDSSKEMSAKNITAMDAMEMVMGYQNSQVWNGADLLANNIHSTVSGEGDLKGTEISPR